MAEVISFVDAQRNFERDKKIVNLLIAGADPHRVAEELGIAKSEVHDAHTRMMGAVPQDYRVRALDLSLRTIDALKRVWWNLAIGPDTVPTVRETATRMIMRLEDQRAERVGIKQLPTRDDALDELKQGETSTENLKRLFLEMRQQQPPTIDGKAQEVPE